MFRCDTRLSQHGGTGMLTAPLAVTVTRAQERPVHLEANTTTKAASSDQRIHTIVFFSPVAHFCKYTLTDADGERLSC